MTLLWQNGVIVLSEGDNYYVKWANVIVFNATSSNKYVFLSGFNVVVSVYFVSDRFLHLYTALVI